MESRPEELVERWCDLARIYRRPEIYLFSSRQRVSSFVKYQARDPGPKEAAEIIGLRELVSLGG